jgi:hypothetical protein
VGNIGGAYLKLLNAINTNTKIPSPIYSSGPLNFAFTFSVRNFPKKVFLFSFQETLFAFVSKSFFVFMRKIKLFQVKNKNSKIGPHTGAYFETYLPVIFPQQIYRILKVGD